MKYILIFFLVFDFYFSYSQKPQIDTSSFRIWPTVGGGAISNDGQYVLYYVFNQPVSSRTLEVKSFTEKWKRSFIGGSQAAFTNDSKRIIFKRNDSLFVSVLGGDMTDIIPNVAEFQLGDTSGNWLSYRLKSPGDTLALYNLTSCEVRKVSNVNCFSILHSGRDLLIGRNFQSKIGLLSRIELLDLKSGISKLVWESQDSNQRLLSYSITANNEQIAFLSEDREMDNASKELWYYTSSMSSALKLLGNSGLGTLADYELSDKRPEFDKTEKNILCGLVRQKGATRKKNGVQVDVWTYLDTLIQPVQEQQYGRELGCEAAVNIESRKLIQLDKPGESVVGYSNQYVLIRSGSGIYVGFERYWNLTARNSYWLVSVLDGKRRLIRDNIANPAEEVGESPRGKWLIYWDLKERNFFSYEVATGKVRNITKTIQTSWFDENNDAPEYKLTWIPLRSTWLANDDGVIIYDNSDIWLIDPSNSRLPVNLTNRYGRRNHIKFELAISNEDLQLIPISSPSSLLLTAFDKINKRRGFFSKAINVAGNPFACSLGDYIYGEWQGHYSFASFPIKAKNTSAYIVERMTVSQAPNYFYTREFKNFIPLSSLQPQRRYNWVTSSLIHWKNTDDSRGTAILYKPENFDSTKRYPVLFNLYEIRSDELNLFIRPIEGTSNINIPWFVSNGYLVCVPDIHYKLGNPGKSACDIVVSAAKYLAKKKYIDSHHMGIQGHSFGGYETNYIITHTNLFAAACSASGVSDLISWYGSFPGFGAPQYAIEQLQDRMNTTLWQSPYQYISNSPIFKADKVCTPLLMLNNKLDQVVPFAQGVEFFMALRRLGKRVWLLQYDGGGHSVNRGKDGMDYSVRMMQFFDHYLKGSPPPRWMTKGVPFSEKGIENGLEIDPDAIAPAPDLKFRSPTSIN